MRLSAVAVALFASTGLASPARRDVRQPVYTLRLSSPVPSLNGVYLTTSSISNATQLGVYPSTPSAKNIHFYTVQDPATGLSELRTTDSSSGATLAVVGANGLLDFASLANPAAVTVPQGGRCDWTSFRLEQGGKKEVRYAGDGGASGSWVVFPAGGNAQGWSVKWKDESAWTTADYMPVQVVYELVKDE